jgi:hypothetical protein
MPGHAEAQGQTLAWCECGSVLLCLVECAVKMAAALEVCTMMVRGRGGRPVCVNSGSACLKHFDPLANS